MPIYNKEDLPMVEANINSANRQMDHADAEMALWQKYRTDAEQRLQFWSDILTAIKKVEKK